MTVRGIFCQDWPISPYREYPMTCPICQKPSVPEFSPFCSRHCKNVDLLKWLNEDYKVPADPVENEVNDSEDES